MRIGAFLGSTALAASLFAASPSEACSPPLSGVTATVPADGGNHPANARVGFQGFDLSLEGLTVTVDGQPASLVDAELGPRGAQLVAAVEPAPGEGQEVHITGDACAFGGDEMCAVDVTYTTTAPDLEAPVVTGAELLVDLHEHRDVDPAIGACMSSSDRTYYATFSAASVTDAYPELVYWRLTAYVGSPDDLRSRRSTRLDDTGLTLRRAGDLEEDLCFQLEAIDTAGHRTVAADTCQLCRLRFDDDGGMVDIPPEEPVWTASDIVPGGACDDGTTIPPGDDEDPANIPAGEPTVVTSGCSTGGSSPPELGWLAILGALAVVSRWRR